jgi:hypothetical protein
MRFPAIPAAVSTYCEARRLRASALPTDESRKLEQTDLPLTSHTRITATTTSASEAKSRRVESTHSASRRGKIP